MTDLNVKHKTIKLLGELGNFQSLGLGNVLRLHTQSTIHTKQNRCIGRCYTPDVCAPPPNPYVGTYPGVAVSGGDFVRRLGLGGVKGGALVNELVPVRVPREPASPLCSPSREGAGSR